MLFDMNYLNRNNSSIGDQKEDAIDDCDSCDPADSMRLQEHEISMFVGKGVDKMVEHCCNNQVELS